MDHAFSATNKYVEASIRQKITILDDLRLVHNSYKDY